MVAGHFLYETSIGAQQALACGAALPERLTPDIPVALYAAALTGESWVLGRYQHEDQVLGTPAARASSAAPGWLRRASGGATTRAGDGVIYVALALHDRSVLMPCPPGRLLNRNVRGVLTGLRQTGLSINYFGRDYLACGAAPVTYVAWDAREHGQILLEFFIAHSASTFVPDGALAYPSRAQPALRGRSPTTIAQAQPALAAAELVQAIADGHTRSFGVRWTQDLQPTHPAPSAAEANDMQAPTRSDGLVWSPPREEAIGFVSAGVRLDACGKMAALHIAGDFFAHRACGPTLEKLLVGRLPCESGVGEAVDAAFARSGYDVEGIRSLSAFRDAILEAAQLHQQLVR